MLLFWVVKLLIGGVRGVREGGGTSARRVHFVNSILIQSCSLNLRDVLVYFLFKNVGFGLLKGRYPNIWEVFQILKIIYSKHLVFYTMHNFHPQGSKKIFFARHWSFIHGVPHSLLIVDLRVPHSSLNVHSRGPSFLIYRSFLFLKISINKIMDEFVSSLQGQAIFSTICTHRVTHKGWDFRDDCAELTQNTFLHSWLLQTVYLFFSL